MAQATPITPSRINVCALRATALAADGTVAPGPKNAWVTNKTISIGVSPNVDDGEEKVLVNGCDTDIAVYESLPKFRGFTLTITKGALEPAFEEMALGGTIVLDASTSPIPIGLQWPNVGDKPPGIAIEAWCQNLIGNHSPGPTDTGIAGQSYPYVRYLWPLVHFTLGDDTLEADMGNQVLVGRTQGNANWGLGPWGDQPVSAQPNGLYVYDAYIPVASTAWLTAGTHT